jgi:Domain of unknown function (DUF309)
VTLEHDVARACVLLEQGHGFEAHEVLEPHWLDAKARGDTDAVCVLQALIKLGAALVKRAHDNARGERSHVDGARHLLALASPQAAVCSVDVDRVARAIDAFVARQPLVLS